MGELVPMLYALIYCEIKSNRSLKNELLESTRYLGKRSVDVMHAYVAVVDPSFPFHILPVYLTSHGSLR